MTNPVIKIVNLDTNEAIERPMTDEEFAAFTESNAKTEALEAARAEREALIASRQAKLKELGLTDAELNA